MDQISIQRSLACGAVWGVTALVLSTVTGIEQSWTDIGVDAAAMAGSAAASDITHGAFGISLVDNTLTSAAGAGVYYALFQKFIRGDDSYISNALFAAANDAAVSTIAYPRS